MPHLRRSGSSSIDAPALSGWADVWRPGPPGLSSGWVLFCGSLMQVLIKLWHCRRPVEQSSKRANLDKSEVQTSPFGKLRAGSAGLSLEMGINPRSTLKPTSSVACEAVPFVQRLSHPR